uniref:Uncharacterized protein n=1 Tax=Anguilla anguilla TaxID=7936 RepID=A0A0E9VGV3_ANGAN
MGNPKKKKGNLEWVRGAMVQSEEMSLQTAVEDGQGFCCSDCSGKMDRVF